MPDDSKKVRIWYAEPSPAPGVTARASSLAAAVALITTIAGCSATGAARPGPEATGNVSQAAISDQAHGGEHAGFFWLPPLVAAPALEGTFDGSQMPIVTITPLVPGASPIATFTMTSGPGSETVRVDYVSQSYVVNWHTDLFNLDPSIEYRIAVLVAGRTAGFLDVDVVTTGGQAKNVDTSQYVPLVDGKTLAVKWFMNACGSVFCAATDACHVAGSCDPNTGACSSPNAPDGTACSDTNACGRTSACRAGACVADVCVPPCNDANDCLRGQGCVDHVCGACNVDADCAGSSAGAKCTGSAGACVECLDNADCTSVAAPECAANACVGCTGDAGCVGHAKLKCELANTDTPSLVGTCVECRSNTTPPSADCTSDSTPVCDSASGTCVACSGAAGETACRQNHGGRHCEENNTPAALNGTCVVCRGELSVASTDCGAQTPLCNPTTDTCGPCDTDGTSECLKFGPAFICDNPAGGGTGACVGCVTDDDCLDPAFPHCVTRMCVGCDSTTPTHGDESCTRFASLGMPACQPNDGVTLSPGSCAACSATNTSQCTAASPSCNVATGSCQP